MALKKNVAWRDEVDAHKKKMQDKALEKITQARAADDKVAERNERKAAAPVKRGFGRRA